MNAIQKIINKASWRYHVNGGYWEREILDGNRLDEAAAELAAKDAVVEAAREINYRCQNDWEVQFCSDDQTFEVVLTGAQMKQLAAALANLDSLPS